MHPRPADTSEASGAAPEGGIPDRLDLQTILTRSFEASGLLKTVEGEAPADAAANAPADAPGRDDEGCRIKSVDCRLELGSRPRLSYTRRLDLQAALNAFTTAAFTVLVDGEPVDEAAANGMDYAEEEWARRADIDIGRFAGRTVSLTFTVEANSNLCREVSARAWVRDIVVDEAAPAPAAGGGEDGEADAGDESLAPI